MDWSGILSTIFGFFTHFSTYMGYVVSFLTTLIGVFMIVPGDQPEAFLKQVVAWIEAHSN